MAKHLQSFTIEGFRGIQDLTVESLNHVNIIAGDNNCGKTSVLEALCLLRSPAYFSNALLSMRVRDGVRYMGTSIYTMFMDAFPKTASRLCVGVRAQTEQKTELACHIEGEEKRFVLQPETLRERTVQSLGFFPSTRAHKEAIETAGFEGTLRSVVNGVEKTENIMLDGYMFSWRVEKAREEVLPVLYLSPSAHTRDNTFASILRNDTYKALCIAVLQLFDAQIVDLLLLKSEDEMQTVEYIKHEKLGNMPLSTYGDGIKKVLTLAGGIARAANGVLLIDEVETAIHQKYFKDIFTFVVRACKQFQVQLFVTTHSIEAIDGLLATQEYAEQENEDDVTVVTFQKSSSGEKTYARNLAGRTVFQNRERFDFEVRL